MTENDIKKRIFFTSLLLIALIIGYAYAKPYIPQIVSKYNDIKTSIIGDSTKEKTSEEITQEVETTSQQVEQIPLAKLVDINFSGDNGHGQAEYELNDDLIQNLDSLTEDEKKEFTDSLSISFSKENELSNQEKINVIVDVSKKYTKYLDSQSFEVEVSELEEQESFSISLLKEDIDIEYKGFNGKSTAILKTDFKTPFDQLTTIIDQPKTNYSNGDQIRIILTEDSIKKLEDMGYQVKENNALTFKVEGLEEPIKIKHEDIDKHVVINFVGTSGVGKAKIDTTFQPPLSKFLNDKAFVIQNDGNIRNNEEVSIRIHPDVIKKLKDEGFEFEEEIEMIRSANNLPEVSEELESTKNVKDLLEKIQKEIDRKYPETLFGSFDIKLERYYYRPFHVENDIIDVENSTHDGTLIAVYTINTLSKDKKEQLKSERLIFGYTDLYINSKNEIKLKSGKQFLKSYDDTYSLDSIFQIIEGYHFKAIKF